MILIYYKPYLEFLNAEAFEKAKGIFIKSLWSADLVNLDQGPMAKFASKNLHESSNATMHKALLYADALNVYSQKTYLKLPWVWIQTFGPRELGLLV